MDRQWTSQPGETWKWRTWNADLNTIWNGSALVTWADGDVATYGRPVTEIASGEYGFDFPTAITTPGKYYLRATKIAGSSLALSDIATGAQLEGEIYWNGKEETRVTSYLLPVASTVSTGAVGNKLLECATGEAPTFTWTIVDGAGDAVDCSGKRLEFVIYNPGVSATTTILAISTDGPQLVVNGTYNNQVAVSLTTGNTASALSASFVLWNRTDNLRLSEGTINIKLVP